MNQKNDTISRRQITAVIFLCMLPPIVRALPRAVVEISGYAAWISCILTFIPLALFIMFICYFMRSKGPGRGLGQIITSILGDKSGKIVIILYCAWMVFYFGYMLRSSSDRFVSTLFPHSRRWIFIIVTLAIALTAALGNLRSIARTAMLLRPLLLTVLAVIFAFSLKNINPDDFLAVSRYEIPSILNGAVPLINLFAILVFFLFLEGRVEGPMRSRPLLGWLSALLLFSMLLCVTTSAAFGADRVSKSDYALFLMVRDVNILNLIERAESVVIALWAFSDFIIFSTVLYTISFSLRMCFNIAPAEKPPKFLDMKNGRWITWVCAAISFAVSLILAPTSAELHAIAGGVIPWTNAALFYGLIPLIFIIGKIRKVI